jgi:hypothetical protein
VIVTFGDADGETGRATDDRSLEYDGECHEDVAVCVADVEERYRNGDTLLGEAALSALVSELPAVPRVVGVERHHE